MGQRWSRTAVHEKTHAEEARNASTTTNTAERAIAIWILWQRARRLKKLKKRKESARGKTTRQGLIAGGYAHSLALRRDGSIHSWGRNNFEQAPPEGFAGNFVSLAARVDFSIALRSDGTVACWGRNNDGQAPPGGVRGAFVAIDAGFQHSLALTREGKVVCWGNNVYGQAPRGGVQGDFVSIAGGGNHSLALGRDGSVTCWGANDFGQAPSEGVRGDFVAIAGGYWHSLALRRDGRVVCWGRNTHGQAPPEGFPDDDFVAIATGAEHSLALRRTGSIKFWGRNDEGQAPRHDVGTHKFVAIAGGRAHSLALVSQDGHTAVACWGSNWFGEAPREHVKGTFEVPTLTRTDGENFLVSRKWSYVPRGAFQGSSWNNYHGCLYTFTQIGDDNVLNLENTKGCLDDTFVRARATWHKNNNSIDITFEIDKGTYTTTTATFAADCSLLDTADGGMYVGGHDGGRDHPMDFAPHEWLEAATAWVVRAATVTPQQTKGLPRHITPGIPVAPGAPPAYQAIYMRDGYYGIKHAFDLVNASMRQDWLASFEYLLERPRADGVLPVSCHPDDSARGPYCEYGAALMCNDTVGHPGWSTCRTLDSGPFAALLAAHVYDNFFASNEQQAVAWYEKWSFTLIEGLMQTTRNPDGCGLVWSNTTQPNVGYGFQDTVRKSGDVLYSSILFWQACVELSRIAESSGDVKTSTWLRGLAEGMREAASARLWDSSVGAFRASTKVESDHVDVWGNALAAHLHFATEEQETSIFALFQRRERDIFYEGQVREILFPEQWSEAWPDWSVRSYQNGGYWATPHHHVLPFLARHDRAMACRLLNATISSFRGHGIWEWVGPFWPSVAHGAPGYVASAANTRAASRELACMTL